MIYDLIIIILEVFRIFWALEKIVIFLVFLPERLRGMGGCRVIPSNEPNRSSLCAQGILVIFKISNL